MKKLYDKNELYFALLWIGIYVVLMSAADNASKTLGMDKETSSEKRIRSLLL